MEGTRSKLLGIRYLVLGTRYYMLGTRSQVGSNMNLLGILGYGRYVKYVGRVRTFNSETHLTILAFWADHFVQPTRPLGADAKQPTAGCLSLNERNDGTAPHMVIFLGNPPPGFGRTLNVL